MCDLLIFTGAITQRRITSKIPTNKEKKMDYSFLFFCANAKFQNR